MKCPVCKQELLQRTTLESNLPAYQCAGCAGIWLQSNDYLAWLKAQGTAQPSKAAGEIPVPTWDLPTLKLCPDCKRIMLRFKILPNVDFYLDRCSHCNGVWFDKNEWEVLVARNLHDKVNQFFTEPWQLHVREEEAHSALDKFYSQKFGAADYAKLQEIRGWLQTHPLRAMFLAYLQADDPYKF